jgi:hypothetical protein
MSLKLTLMAAEMQFIKRTTRYALSSIIRIEITTKLKFYKYRRHQEDPSDRI